MRETVSELDKKKNEYDVLIRQCKDLKGKYEGLCDEMELMLILLKNVIIATK